MAKNARKVTLATSAAPAAKGAPNADKLAAVHAAAWAKAGGAVQAAAAILAAGAKQEATKAAFMQAYVARILNPKAETFTAELLADAARVLQLPNSKATTKANRRTLAQDKAESAARSAWRHVLRFAGVETTEKRGGKAGALASKAKAKAKAEAAATKAAQEAPAPVVIHGAQAAPTIKAPVDAVAFVAQQAAMLLAFSNKSAKAVPLAVKEAIVAFGKAIAAAEQTSRDEAATKEAA